MAGRVHGQDQLLSRDGPIAARKVRPALHSLRCLFQFDLAGGEAFMSLSWISAPPKVRKAARLDMQSEEALS